MGSNNFDGPVILDDETTYYGFGRVAGSDVSFRSRIHWTASDPNGVLSAPIGSLAMGPSGTWVNVDGGTAWVLQNGGQGQQPIIFSLKAAANSSNSNPAPIPETLINLPAGCLNAAGRVLRITYAGAVTGTDGVSTLASGLVLGDQANPNNYYPIGSTIVPTINHQFSAQFQFTIRTPVTGAFGSSGWGNGATSATSTVGCFSASGPNVGATPLDLPGVIPVSFFCGFGVVNPTNVLRIDTWIVEVLAPSQ